jgi:biopolymer transport protein ExbD
MFKKKEKKKKKKGGLIRFLLRLIVLLIIIIVILVLFAKFGADGTLRDAARGLPLVKDIVKTMDDPENNDNSDIKLIGISISEEKILINGEETVKDKIIEKIKELDPDAKKVVLNDSEAKHMIYQEVLELLKNEGYIVIEEMDE